MLDVHEKSIKVSSIIMLDLAMGVDEQFLNITNDEKFTLDQRREMADNFKESHQQDLNSLLGSIGFMVENSTSLCEYIVFTIFDISYNLDSSTSIIAQDLWSRISQRALSTKRF